MFRKPTEPNGGVGKPLQYSGVNYFYVDYPTENIWNRLEVQSILTRNGLEDQLSITQPENK